MMRSTQPPSFFTPESRTTEERGPGCGAAIAGRRCAQCDERVYHALRFFTTFLRT
ncbi:MAG: hypothetical protein NVS9B3_11350 [Gemmatimonadaceae bacterium]